MSIFLLGVIHSETYERYIIFTLKIGASLNANWQTFLNFNTGFYNAVATGSKSTKIE